MKLSRVFSKSFHRTCSNGKTTRKMAPKSPERDQMPPVDRANFTELYSNTADDGLEVIDWELRPGGMLVQRRDQSGVIKVKVSHGLYQHEITISAQATFGDMKWLLAQEIGLQPHEQRLIFRGKEKEDNEFLHIAGVKDMAKVILVEDPASKERKLEEMKRNDGVVKACQAIAQVRAEIDQLVGQVAALDRVVNSGSKVADRDFRVLSELLMKQLLKLDSIDAEGEAKVQRRIEVRRVQNNMEQVDGLKMHNSNPIRNNTVTVMTQWETFDSGFGSLTAPPQNAATLTNSWELFD